MPNFLRIECPGCKAVLQIDDALAGKQGKCIHCGHRIIVPGTSGPAAPPPSSVIFLSEAPPEAMVRELHARNLSALLLVFEPSADGSYDLADVPDANLKCIATEDINQSRFSALATSISKRFAPKKPAAKSPRAAPPVSPAAPPATQPGPTESLGEGTTGPGDAYELKGDRLGMSLEAFKEKYARFTPDLRQDLPICSDQSYSAGKADLHSEAWHRRAGIVHARVDHPDEDSSPTIAGVKTDLMLYQFVDGQLFRISALFPTDQFHMVIEAAIQKYGPPSRETKQPRELMWENAASQIVLARGTVHPRTASSLHLVHKELHVLADSRAPQAAQDI